MGNKNPKQQQSNSTEMDAEVSLKGTFISVMLVGIFILISWFGLYALFLSR
ncbi:cytochrome c oxidase subunit 2A [Sporosarcina beigongshangi]|uniref:cytochrome c oxidase subunit 2A n=1 Tax=Sporosarcina beigongshangi TaxID=2782538 RepID=UPI001939489A|nr:cytochrome c oxidase subunit 2A [Sporosarcina beigongshangi]